MSNEKPHITKKKKNRTINVAVARNQCYRFLETEFSILKSIKKKNTTTDVIEEEKKKQFCLVFFVIRS